MSCRHFIVGICSGQGRDDRAPGGRCESAGKVTPGRRSKGPPSLGLHVTLYNGASFESSYGGRWESCHSSASASPERSIKVRNRCRDGGHKDGGSAVVQAAVEVTVGVAAVEQRVARGCERRASGQPARLRVECRPRDVDKPAVGVGQVIAEGCFPWRGTVGPGEASRSSGGRVLGSLCKRRGAALGAATSPTDARLGLMFEVAHGRGSWRIAAEPAALGNGVDGHSRVSGGYPGVHLWVWQALSGPL